MLDERDVDRSPLSSFPERYTIDPVAASTLAEAWRDLFARLTRRTRAIAPRVGGEAEAPGSAARSDRLPDRLRAEAHAAFRSVEGPASVALNAALAVMERRIAELNQTVGCYGEALKSIQVYSADEASRATARLALRAAPERLAAAQPVPHLPSRGRRNA